MNGGHGYTPNQVGDMSLDQVCAALAHRDNLRSHSGKVKRATSTEVAVGFKADKDGFVKGRDAAGNPMKARVGGKSQVQMVRERKAAEAAAAAKAKADEEAKQRRRRRRGH